MITISLSQALLLYSAIVLIGAMVIWVYTQVTMQRAQRVLGRQYLWRCFYCAYSYLDEEAEAVSECPRCHSFNAREDAQPAYAGARNPGKTQDAPAEDRPRRNPSHRRRPGARTRGPRKRRR